MIRPNDRCTDHMKQLAADLDALARISDERTVLLRAMMVAASKADIAGVMETRARVLEVLARENARTGIVVSGVNSIARLDPVAYADAVRDAPRPPTVPVTIVTSGPTESVPTIERLARASGANFIELTPDNAVEVIGHLDIPSCRAVLEMHGPRCNDAGCRILDIARARIVELGGTP